MKKVILASALFAPAFVFAAGGGGFNNIGLLVVGIADIVRLVLPIVFTLILVYFFWGLAVFVLNAGDDEKRKSGKNMMLWGIVALFVAASIWGIVKFMGQALDIDTGGGTVQTPDTSL